MISSKPEILVEPLNLANPQALLSTLQELRQTVESEGQATFSQWRSQIRLLELPSSALNLADERLTIFCIAALSLLTANSKSLMNLKTSTGNNEYV